LLKSLSNLALNTSRERASTASLGNLLPSRRKLETMRRSPLNLFFSRITKPVLCDSATRTFPPALQPSQWICSKVFLVFLAVRSPKLDRELQIYSHMSNRRQ